MKDKEQQRIYMKKYYQTHKEKLKSYSSQYKRKHKPNYCEGELQVKKGPFLISFN